MKSLRLLFFLLVAGVGFCYSQNCQTASAVPAGQLRLGGGRVILDNDGVVSLNGGPAVYTKIKNRSTADLSYWVAVEVLSDSTKRYETNCTFRAVLGPSATAVVLGSSSGKEPVPWRVSVTIGPESDGDERMEGLVYEVYSNPPKKNSN